MYSLVGFGLTSNEPAPSLAAFALRPGVDTIAYARLTVYSLR
jgi:hypothetical protein